MHIEKDITKLPATLQYASKAWYWAHLSSFLTASRVIIVELFQLLICLQHHMPPALDLLVLAPVMSILTIIFCIVLAIRNYYGASNGIVPGTD